MNPIIILRVFKNQGQDAEIDEIRLVNASKAFSQFNPDTQIPRRQGGMLPAGALAIVIAPDHCAFAALFGSGNKSGVYGLIDESTDSRDITPERQNLTTRGHDVICGDVIANFQEYLALPGLRNGGKLWERLDIGSPDDLTGLARV